MARRKGANSDSSKEADELIAKGASLLSQMTVFPRLAEQLIDEPADTTTVSNANLSSDKCHEVIPPSSLMGWNYGNAPGVRVYQMTGPVADGYGRYSTTDGASTSSSIIGGDPNLEPITSLYYVTWKQY